MKDTFLYGRRFLETGLFFSLGNFRFIAYSVRSLSEVICIILLRGRNTGIF